MASMVYLWAVLSFGLVTIANGKNRNEWIAERDKRDSSQPPICSNKCTYIKPSTAETTEQCQIGQECAKPSKSKVIQEYPSLPETFRAEATDGVLGYYLTWIPPQYGSHDKLTGFEIISRNLNNPKNSTCVLYSIDATISASLEFRFCHDYHEGSSYYHEIRTLPVKNRETDYKHIMVMAYKQDHDAYNTNKWAPNVVEIYNDSCAGAVAVTFTLAPPAYDFKHYIVELCSVSGDCYTNDTTLSQVELSNNSKTKTIKFTNVTSNTYTVTIFVEVDNKRCTCKLKQKCEGCGYTQSHPFEINSCHNKCQRCLPVEFVGKEGDPSNTFLATVSGATFIATIVFVTTCIVICTIKKKSETRFKKEENTSPEEHVRLDAATDTTQPGNAKVLTTIHPHTKIYQTHLPDFDTIYQSHAAEGDDRSVLTGSTVPDNYNQYESGIASAGTFSMPIVTES